MPGGAVCEDDCVYASDGECDDGGPGTISRIDQVHYSEEQQTTPYAACDYGHDCTDCGGRPLLPPAPPETAAAAPSYPPFDLFPSGCVPERGSSGEPITLISFSNSQLYRSNLGGQGGVCDVEGYEDRCLVNTAPRAGTLDTGPEVQDIYIENVGVTDYGEQIDLKITNETEYRAWNPTVNGLASRAGSKSQTEKFGQDGNFSVVNVLGPRPWCNTSDPREASRCVYWHLDGLGDKMTYVQLRYTFIGHSTGHPVKLHHTYLTFFDLDAGRSRSESSEQYSALAYSLGLMDYPTALSSFSAGMECVALKAYPEESLHGMGPGYGVADDGSQYTKVMELDAKFQAALLRSTLAETPDFSSEGEWKRHPLFCGATQGIGKDNPASPEILTEDHKSKTILANLYDLSSFSVRVAVVPSTT